MTTSDPAVQWRQGANGVWEYLASDGQWYAANPAAGTPLPPSGGPADSTILPTAPNTSASPYPQAPVAAPAAAAAPVYGQPSAGYAPPQIACPRCGTLYDLNRRACPNCAAVNGYPYLQLTAPGRRFGQYLLDILLSIVTLIIGYIIWSFVIWGRGQTPGMQLLHIRVVKKDDLTVAGWGTMALREIVGKGLIFLAIGAVPLVGEIAAIILYFMLLWDEDRQQLWDKVAGTVVIDGDPPPKTVGQAPALPPS